MHPETYKSDTLIKTPANRAYLVKLFKEYQEQEVIPLLRDSGQRLDEIMGSNYYSELTEQQIKYMNRFVDVYPEAFTEIERPIANPGVRRDRWAGVDVEPYYERLLAVHKAHIDLASFEHQHILGLSFKYGDQKYIDTLRMLADTAYGQSKTPQGLAMNTLPFVNPELFTTMDRFGFQVWGDKYQGYEGKLPDKYFNRMKAELELYKKQNYNQPLRAIFRSPPALLDLPEDEMEDIRRRGRDIQQAVSSDALAPFVHIAVTAMMEFGAGGFRSSPKSSLRGELPIGKNRSAPKSRSRETSRPKSEAPCISSTLMPGWQMALSQPDVFLGITAPAFAGCLKEGWSQEFKDNPKFKGNPYYENLPLENAPGNFKFEPPSLKNGKVDWNKIKTKEGLLDSEGNIWKIDKTSIKNGQDNLHWDVQLKKGGYKNVNPDGTLNH